MTAAEIRQVKIPAESFTSGEDAARLIFEALTEIAAQLAESNEREDKHEAELKTIIQLRRGIGEA